MRSCLSLALALASTSTLGCKAASQPEPVGTIGVATISSAVVAVPLAGSRPPAAADGTYTVGGLHYIEFVSGGARDDEALPMVVLLHGMGLRPRMFTSVVEPYSQKARFILPYGFLTAGQGFAWFDTRTETAGPRSLLDAELPRVADQITSALASIRAVRPTVGKIVVGGFSQGSELAYGLALLHPEAFVRVCAMSGALTAEILKRPRFDGPKPEVHGFHGADDLVIRTAAGQGTISAFTSLGYVADMKVYPGVGHNFLAATSDVSACIQAGARAASAP